MGQMLKGLLLVAVLAGLAAVGFLTAGGRAAVPWQELRVVAFESDDWGLAGFVPSAEAWQGVDREALAPGRFPPVYWGSTLEDSATVAALAASLHRTRGRDGRPAVFQPNYVTGSMEWRHGRWRSHRLPDFPAAYDRPGLWSAVAEAISAGVWHAEWHASWHYDPELRRERGLADANARLASERGILLFPGSEQARELGPWRPTAALEAELVASLATFTSVFGRPARSVIAPDYTWNARVEDLWQRHGLLIVQGKREQRNPDLPGGRWGRAAKFVLRHWDALRHPERTYLERNCRFEPAQHADAAAVVASCLGEVRRAWARGQAAIVETHRVNFAHTDAAVAAGGLAAFSDLLAALEPAECLFLTGDEIAQLTRKGVSVRAAGDTLILRNATRSRRVLDLGPGSGGEPRLVALDAGASLTVDRPAP